MLKLNYTWTIYTQQAMHVYSDLSPVSLSFFNMKPDLHPLLHTEQNPTQEWAENKSQSHKHFKNATPPKISHEYFRKLKGIGGADNNNHLICNM